MRMHKYMNDDDDNLSWPKGVPLNKDANEMGSSWFDDDERMLLLIGLFILHNDSDRSSSIDGIES